MCNRPTRAAALVVLAAWILSAAPLEAAGELHVITLKHRPAEELIPLLRPVLEPGEALSGSDYRLIVRTSDKNLAALRRLVEQLDIARVELVISVLQVAVADRERELQRLRGEVAVDDDTRVVLRSTAPRDAPGESIARRDEIGQLRYETSRRTTSMREGSAHSLRVNDGARAYLRVGRSIPHIQRLVVLSGRGAFAAHGIEWRDVTSGFDVRPRLSGDRVLLEITPRLSAPGNAGIDSVRFHELTTTLSARLGEWIDLGTAYGAHDEIGRTILDSSVATGGEEYTVLVKVERAGVGPQPRE